MARNYHQGRYTPRNPEKYVGDPNDIFLRSSWERKLAVFLDTNPSILKWSSETFVIPYVCAVRNNIHRYYVDFAVMYKNKAGEVKKALVEVKPKSQSVPPEQKKKRTAKYLKEVETYAINQSKWKAATEWCKKNGMDFIVMNESDLGIK
jgi:hypothetical protein